MSISDISNGITGVYETHLPVRDLQRSIAFYRDVLGLPLARQLPERSVAFFWVGGKDQGMLGLWGNSSAPLAMTLHFAFRADKQTVLDSCKLLKQKGVQPLGFNGEDISDPVVIGWMPAVTVYFKGPDGHSIEILHRLDEAPDPEFGIQSHSAWLARSQR